MYFKTSYSIFEFLIRSISEEELGISILVTPIEEVKRVQL